MDYNYENLDENRFQQFCQSLLLNAFPDLQCFPIGQPDGGRDALVYMMEEPKDKFSVFQVKYVRNPQSIDKPHKWLLDIMAKEAPKVQKLIPRGAISYYLLTNAQGTAHQDSGSIDKLQAILDDTLEIPGQCWWRDDLNRRLDNAWDLKWSYPEILSGKDVLQIVIAEGLRESQDRRETALKNYIKKQYEIEKDIKFKQIDFTNRLLDVFVDVPIVKRDISRKGTRRVRREIQELMYYRLVRDGTPTFINEEIMGQMQFAFGDEEIGAADLLLRLSPSFTSPKILIEGAPGQGKSTITQYVCQIYRAKILNKIDDLRKMPEKYKKQGVKIPLKLDLRDLALWIGRQNPFVITENKEVPGNWKPTLESFLAAQISYLSGGIEFDVADLYAVSKVSSIFLVLDALDEVPDRERRSQLVSIVEEGLDNLLDNAASLQIVITSRPAAFANSPGFSPSNFDYFELVDLGRADIEEYAEKWIQSRQIDKQAADEIRIILKEKLSQPHLRDLARSPMQLAILLTLIYNRGASL